MIFLLQRKIIPNKILLAESSGKCKITKFFGRTQFWELKSVERNHIIRVLRHTNGNKTETARLFKIGLTTLYRKIEEFGIKECIYDAMYRLTVLSTLVDTMLESQYRLYYNDDEYDFLSNVQYDRETKVFRAEITCKRR